MLYSSGSVVQCNSNIDCEKIPSQPKCIDNKCSCSVINSDQTTDTCLINSDNKKTCNIDTRQCVQCFGNRGCSNNQHCDDSTNTCANNACTEYSCDANYYCNPTTGQCTTGCRNHIDCYNGYHCDNDKQICVSNNPENRNNPQNKMKTWKIVVITISSILLLVLIGLLVYGVAKKMIPKSQYDFEMNPIPQEKKLSNIQKVEKELSDVQNVEKELSKVQNVTEELNASYPECGEKLKNTKQTITSLIKNEIFRYLPYLSESKKDNIIDQLDVLSKESELNVETIWRLQRIVDDLQNIIQEQASIFDKLFNFANDEPGNIQLQNNRLIIQLIRQLQTNDEIQLLINKVEHKAMTNKLTNEILIKFINTYILTTKNQINISTAKKTIDVINKTLKDYTAIYNTFFDTNNRFSAQISKLIVNLQITTNCNHNIAKNVNELLMFLKKFGNFLNGTVLTNEKIELFETLSNRLKANINEDNFNETIKIIALIKFEMIKIKCTGNDYIQSDNFQQLQKEYNELITNNHFAKAEKLLTFINEKCNL